MPKAVQTALDPDSLQPANGKQYQRDKQDNGGIKAIPCWNWKR